MSGFGEERCLPIENTPLITRRIRPERALLRHRQ